METVLYWFRNDLRLHDQPVLSNLSGVRLLPVYVVDESELRPLPPLGLPKMGVRRAVFLLEALADLQQRLFALGSGLYVAVGNPVEVIRQLAEQTKARRIYAQAGHAHDERIMEKKIARILALKLHESQNLVSAQQLPYPLERLPHIFTHFRTDVEPLGKKTAIPAPATSPRQLPPLPQIELPPLPTLEKLGYEPPKTDQRAVLTYQGGETQALNRLHTYIWQHKSLAHYKQTRNQMLGSEYSSKFSAWLAQGSLSVREVYAHVREFERQNGATEDTYWLLFELLWRDFFHLTSQKYGARFFQAGGLKGTPKTFRKDKKLFQQWVEGKTGEPFVDANMRELLHTGFMSNRGRQNVASFLCHDLQLDWRWGAAYFEHALIDYDPCSNWGNWLYLAGLGNDPRPGRRFNVKSQQGRYDPEGKYIAQWLG